MVALVSFLVGTSVRAEIYRWTDEDGQVHYGNSDVLPPGAERADPGPVNSVPPPLIEAAPEPNPETGEGTPDSPPTPKPIPRPTAANWADEHCQVRLRILYTERYYIPCVPTDEVQVYICERQPPRKFRNYFGRQYRYEDRESECGPEVYEGEILYLKRSH